MSAIWNHYERIPEKPFFARCILCEKEYSYRTTISNLKKHLMYKHKGACDNVLNKANTKWNNSLRCDNCKGDIIGYRYSCVQCTKFDLCADCEISFVHEQHFVLRIPEPRPPSQVEAVLACIRKYLMQLESTLMNLGNIDTVSVKSEIKLEKEDIFVEIEPEQFYCPDEDTAIHEMKPNSTSETEETEVESVLPDINTDKQENRTSTQDRRQPQCPKASRMLKKTTKSPNTAKRTVVLGSTEPEHILDLVEPNESDIAKRIRLKPSTSQQAMNNTEQEESTKPNTLDGEDTFLRVAPWTQMNPVHKPNISKNVQLLTILPGPLIKQEQTATS